MKVSEVSCVKDDNSVGGNNMDCIGKVCCYSHPKGLIEKLVVLDEEQERNVSGVMSMRNYEMQHRINEERDTLLDAYFKIDEAICKMLDSNPCETLPS